MSRLLHLAQHAHYLTGKFVIRLPRGKKDKRKGRPVDTRTLAHTHTHTNTHKHKHIHIHTHPPTPTHTHRSNTRLRS